MAPSYTIEGTCEPGFEPVKQLLEDLFHDGLEDKAQVCAYVDGVRVVDLWGHTLDSTESKYGPDSTQTVFSSGKNLTAIVAALMVDRGLLDYDAPVKDYWPEFARNGKEHIRVQDILKHQAGLSFIDQVVESKDLLVDRVKDNSLGSIFEGMQPTYPNKGLKNKDGSESTREYHVLTRGWLMNEVIRRVDPRGRTIGEILVEERDTLGFKHLLCGTQHASGEDDLNAATKSKVMSMPHLLRKTLVPQSYLRSGLDMGSLRELIMMLNGARSDTRKEMVRMAGRYRMEDGRVLEFVKALLDSKGELMKAEISSANCLASARDLASLASTLANRGVDPNGRRLLKEETWAKMHGGITRAAMPVSMLGGPEIPFTQGGFEFRGKDDDQNQPPWKAAGMREGFFGWLGFGGSLMQWHPDLRIGFSYAPTLLHWHDIECVRGSMLQAKVVDCAIKRRTNLS